MSEAPASGIGEGRPPDPGREGPLAPGSGGPGPAVPDEFAPGISLREELGRGARTVVYRAVCRGGEYAVKMVQPPVSEGEADEFRREAATVAALRHPGLAAVHEVGTAGGVPYLVMDLVAGSPLADVLSRGPLDEAGAVRLGREVADALAVAHRAGLVHRDVKPDNIMIRPDGRTSLLDFGLATRIGGTAESGDVAAGTFRYSAPEQTGVLRRAVDGRADLYALGVVLFECLAGAPPFDAPDVGELIRMHLSAAPPDLRSRRPDVAPALVQVVEKLLAKDPDDRYRTGAALCADLARIAAGERNPFPLGIGDDQMAVGGALVGRGAEVARLTARWRPVPGGTGGAVLVLGGAGSGKTSLVRRWAGEVPGAAGHPVLSGVCAADEAAPMAVLSAAVHRYVEPGTRTDAPTRAARLDRLRAAAAGTGGLAAALSPALADALGVPATAAGEGPGEEQFAEAVATLLAELARAEGGAVLHLDDAHHVDPHTRRVLRHLGPLLAGAPLLVVLAARDDPPNAPAVAEIAVDLDRGLVDRMTLPPLDRAGVAALVEATLGPGTPTDLVDMLAARSGGNPMAVGEYLRVIVDSGLLRPSWGSWVLDAARMDELVLPEDVTGLFVRRLDALSEQDRHGLTVAAAVGARFAEALVAAVDPAGGPAVRASLRAAVDGGLVEVTGDGEFHFLHDEIRQTLLADLDPPARRDLHQRIAEQVQRIGGTGPDWVYHVAQHFLAGDWHRSPDRTFQTVARAGALALSRFAPATAYDLLASAGRVARTCGIAVDAGFLTDLGVAATRTDHYEVAHESLDAALEHEQDPVRRARLYGHKARAYHIRWEADAALETVRHAYAALGRPMPRNAVALALSTLPLYLAGGVVRRLPERLRVVRDERRREWYRLYCELSHIGAGSAAMAMRPQLMGFIDMRAVLAANRLGPGPEYASKRASLGLIAAAMGRRGRAARLAAEAAEIAARLGDPVLIARIAWMDGMGHELSHDPGGDAGPALGPVIEEHGRWLDLGEYLAAVMVVGHAWLLRGYPGVAAQWYERCTERMSAQAPGLARARLAPQAHVAALSGRAAEAVAVLDEVQARVARDPGNALEHASVAVARVYLAVELDELDRLDAEYDAAMAQFAARRITPATAWSHYRAVWLHHAAGRLAQVEAAPAGERADRLAAAGRAVTRLRRVAKDPLLRAYAVVADASLRQLNGDHRGALRRLGRLRDETAGRDAPLVDFEIFRIRAAAHRALGHAGDARREAEMAAMLATRYGWPHRARRVQKQFGLGAAGAASAVGSPTSASLSGGSTRFGPTGLQQRRLEALHEVSVASATVLDPEQLTRVALREMVRIFGAERAFVFLTDSGGDTLRPFLGMDAAGTEFAELTGYGSTLVDRVRDTGEAVVVTGSEEGVALGSQSTLVHGLRSIMVAPMVLKGRLQGVVYLDSRAVKGIFTTDDVEILAAITNQVALALETARAAQLEIAVRSAQRDRDIAQMLHTAMTEVGGTLDPDEVGRRLVASVARVLVADGAVLLRLNPDGTAEAVGHGPGVAVPPVVDPASDPALAAVLAAGTAWYGAAAATPPPALLPATVASWLAVPVELRGERQGFLLAGAAARQYTAVDAEIAAALCGQGAVAMDNALLFQRAQDLATRDGLTGLFNRRHFYEIAERSVHMHRRYGRSVAAVMVDIDHFKGINDTYGHTVGDEVIREVARRLAAALRGADVICRYGGEEFAVLLPETGADEALRAANRLHEAVSGRPVDTAAGALPVTVSAGVADVAHDGVALDGLLKYADEALYEAKRAGRDRVAVAAPG